MDLLPAIIFSVVIVPLFYVIIGLLSVSRYVNASVTNISADFQASVSGEGAAERPLGGAMRALAVFLAMSVLLGAVALVAWMSQDAIRVIALMTTTFMIWILIAAQTNAGYSSVQFWIGTIAAAWLLVARLWWPDNWVWGGIASLLATASMILAYRTVRFRLLAIVSAGLFAYDAVHVYGTGLMMTVAESSGGATSSLMVAIPQSAAVESAASYQVGLGDIGFPGLWMMLAFRMADAHARPIVALTTIAGIVLGWIATIATCELTQHPVPALIFLVPGAALGYLASAIPLRLDEKQVAAEA